MKLNIYIYKNLYCYTTLRVVLYGKYIEFYNISILNKIYDFYYLFTKKLIYEDIDSHYINFNNYKIQIFTYDKCYEICINDRFYRKVKNVNEGLNEELKYKILNKIGYYN